MSEIRSNVRSIDDKEKLVQSLKKKYSEMCDKVYGVFQLLNIRRSDMEKLGIIDRPNEKNILSYFKEMEKKSDEILYVMNCVEESCLTVRLDNYDDALSSDGDSTQNLISKDYHGVKIKTHRTLRVDDPSALPIPPENLEIEKFTSPCP